MKRSALIAAAAAVLMPLAVSAAARDDLAAFTRGLKGLDGQFSQKVFDANGKQKEATTGRVAMSAPRLFRWEYKQPHPQLIVADGKKVWVYDPDLQQVTVRPQGVEEQNSPLAALIDPGKLDRDFRVAEAGKLDGLAWLLLSPKAEDQASFQSAKLGFGQNGLAKMQIVDMLGQRTEITFAGWKRNPSFAAGTFAYKPPQGVDVIGEE